MQTLDPREMLCGISAAQLLELVQWVEGGGKGDGKIKDRKIKDITALYGIIKGWLTVSPGHCNTFLEFQKDVHCSSNSSVLRSYFVRKELARLLHLCVSGEPPPAVAAALCGGGGKPPLTVRALSALLLVSKSKPSVLEGAGTQWDPRGVGRVYVCSERGAEKAEVPLG